MILILDFGSQYTQLIARRVREAHVYCEIHPYSLPLERITAMQPEGIILSGGPVSVYEEGAPLPAREVTDLGVPVLGICYGMNVLTLFGGGQVGRAPRREYGPADLIVDDDRDLFAGFERAHDPGVDEPRRQDGIAAARLAGAGTQRQLADRRHGRSATPPLRRAVPPRGGAHAARQGGPRQLPVPHLQGEGRLDDGELRRARDGAHPRSASAAPASSARSAAASTPR